jgi:hypothetical protein
LPCDPSARLRGLRENVHVAISSASDLSKGGVSAGDVGARRPFARPD